MKQTQKGMKYVLCRGADSGEHGTFRPLEIGLGGQLINCVPPPKNFFSSKIKIERYNKK